MRIAIVNVAFVDIPNAVRVLNYSRKQFTAEAYLMAPINPVNIEGCPTLCGQFIRIPYLPKDAISWPVLAMGCFFDADFIIYVQNDGFIIHGENWLWQFLDYDYIGVPWPANYPGGQRVGGGGFSLRSQRLHRAIQKYLHLFPANIPAPHTGEDFWIASVMRQQFEAEGIRYAPLDVATAWGIEARTPDMQHGDERCFGFHKFNTPEREKYKELICESQ